MVVMAGQVIVTPGETTAIASIVDPWKPMKTIEGPRIYMEHLICYEGCYTSTHVWWSWGLGDIRAGHPKVWRLLASGAPLLGNPVEMGVIGFPVLTPIYRAGANIISAPGAPILGNAKTAPVPILTFSKQAILPILAYRRHILFHALAPDSAVFLRFERFLGDAQPKRSRLCSSASLSVRF